MYRKFEETNLFCWGVRFVLAVIYGTIDKIFMVFVKSFDYLKNIYILIGRTDNQLLNLSI